MNPAEWSQMFDQNIRDPDTNQQYRFQFHNIDMDTFDAYKEHPESTEAEDTGVSNAFIQSLSAQVVNGQHVNTSASTLHADGPQGVATQNTSTVASGFPLIMDPNATSHSFLVRTVNPSSAAASQVAIPQANIATFASAQEGPSSASSSSSTLPLGNFATGVGTQSTNAHHIMPPGPGIDFSGSAMEGISYDGHTANIQSHNSQTAPSVNQANSGTGLHQTSHTVNTSPPNVSAVGYSATFSNSGNTNANANVNAQVIRNLHPAQMNNAAGPTFHIAPTSVGANNPRGASVAAANPRMGTLAAAYQAYYQTYPANNQSRAAQHVNPNHGVQTTTTLNTNVQPVQGLGHAANPGLATYAQRQAAALRALMAQTTQFRIMHPRVQDPQNHTQGPFLDQNDPVSVEISQRVTNSRALIEHRHRAHAIAVKRQSNRLRQHYLLPPDQGQPTNQDADSQATNQDPASSSETTQTTDNAFDVMFHVIADQDTQLAAAGLDDRGLPIPPGPVQVYTENDSLQAYLIRQQLVAGITPDEVVPMNSYLTQQRLLHGPMRASNPALIRVHRDTGAVTIPYIPPARFNGRLDPLPLDTQSWYPARSRGAQTCPSDESPPQLDESNEINQDAFGSDRELLRNVLPDGTQQTTDNDVVMSNSDGTTPQSPNSEGSNQTNQSAM
ncbi:hypothetical protein N7486_002662 [Penicillium sp. IBT 16267x]|nr:hypothetical protein N7486_002662 [Penicillium sp. IBT 16267x]